MKQTFTVNGMSCAGCQAHVASAVHTLAGVNTVEVNLFQNRLCVQYGPAVVSPVQIMQAVVRDACEAQLAETEFSFQTFTPKETAAFKRRFFLSSCGLFTQHYYKLPTINPLIKVGRCGVAADAPHWQQFIPKKFEINKEMEMRKIIEIRGMTCGHCAMHVERALNGLEGVRARVNLDTKTAILESGVEVADAIICETVQNAGYEVVSIY